MGTDRHSLCDAMRRASSGLLDERLEARGTTNSTINGSRDVSPLSPCHVADVVEANFPDGQIETSCNRSNVAIHKDIPVHPIEATFS